MEHVDPVEEDLNRFDEAQGMFVKGVNYAKNSDHLGQAWDVLSKSKAARSPSVKVVATTDHTGELPRRTVKPDGTSVDPKIRDEAPMITFDMPILGDTGELAKEIVAAVMFIWKTCVAFNCGADENLEKIASLMALILQDMSNYPSEAECYLINVIRKFYGACAGIRRTVGENERHMTASSWRKHTQELFKETLYGVGMSLYHIESAFKTSQALRSRDLAPLLNPIGSTQFFADEFGVETIELNADKLKEILVDKLQISEIKGLPSYNDERSTQVHHSQSRCGTVYKVEDDQGELYAVKLLRSESVESTICLRYIREVRGWRMLDHKNILPFYGVRLMFEDRLPGLVSKWCNGGDILKYLKEHPNTPKEFRIRLVSEAAQGLEHMHSKGVIHNDIKPENIVIDENGDGEMPQVYLCDFGSSRLMDNVRGLTTSKGCSALFLAPEVALDLAPQSPASDVFSFGCVFLQVVYEKTPYPSIRDNDKLKKARIDGHGPETDFDATFKESVPPTHLKFMTKCWDIVPSRRITAREAAATLASL